MKKLLLLLTLVGFMAACGNNEPSPKQKVYSIYNRLYDALDDDTPNRFISIYEEAEKIVSSASKEELNEMHKAFKQWQNENPQKCELIEAAIGELYESGMI